MPLPIKLLIHSIFWMVYLAFVITFSKISQAPLAWNDQIIHLILNTIWGTAMFYLFYLHFYKYFEKRKFLIYLSASTIASFFVSAIFFGIFKLIYHNTLPDYKIMLIPVLGSFIFAQCGCLVRGFENWFESMKIKMELENRNLKNELELLKSQVNPHFLFNSLNNIDVLIQKSPEIASQALINLSEMLRYMIYESDTEKVLLSKEIDYLYNYVKLQKLRFKNEMYITSNLPEETCSVSVAPMLFIPFVENAFKYSVFKGSYPVIEMSITCHSSTVKFECKNYFDDKVEKNHRSGGVGLQNVRKRLELLYPQKHSLDILKENNIFKVRLEVQI